MRAALFLHNWWVLFRGLFGNFFLEYMHTRVCMVPLPLPLPLPHLPLNHITGNYAEVLNLLVQDLCVLFPAIAIRFISYIARHFELEPISVTDRIFPMKPETHT